MSRNEKKIKHNFRKHPRTKIKYDWVCLHCPERCYYGSTVRSSIHVIFHIYLYFSFACTLFICLRRILIHSRTCHSIGRVISSASFLAGTSSWGTAFPLWRQRVSHHTLAMGFPHLFAIYLMSSYIPGAEYGLIPPIEPLSKLGRSSDNTQNQDGRTHFDILSVDDRKNFFVSKID